jgi:hypothetical protein
MVIARFFGNLRLPELRNRYAKIVAHQITICSFWPLQSGFWTHSANNSYNFAGVYQMGDVQARCWTVAATFGFGGRLSLAAQ